MSWASGKTVIITGASGGIGKTIANQFCELGAQVVINSRNQLTLKEVQNEFASKGHDVKIISGDVTNFDDCKRIVEASIQYFGKVDVLINNASQTLNEHFDCLKPEVFKRVVDVNLIGTSNMIYAALPSLKSSKGSVVFLSSVAGLNGMPGASAYSAGKMALTALWQSLQIELKSSGIHFGIAYINFTKNDESKRMLDGKGAPIPVPNRPKFIQQSQLTVANEVIGLIKNRRSKKVFSHSGKVMAFLIRFFPNGFNKLFRTLYQKRQRQTG